MKQYTPENITELQDNEIFVFGSNLHGIHGSGAAKAAMGFGAILGCGEGLQGQCYAFPTVSSPGKSHRLSFEVLCQKMGVFMKVVDANPDKIFYLTKIGTNLAGIPMEEMKRVFWSSYGGQENLIFPIEFELTQEELDSF